MAQRWQCTACNREYVDVHNWGTPAHGGAAPFAFPAEGTCPACGGVVARVTFSPIFPGADINTGRAEISRTAPIPPSPIHPVYTEPNPNPGQFENQVI